jgi:hypothetical protein
MEKHGTGNAPGKEQEKVPTGTLAGSQAVADRKRYRVVYRKPAMAESVSAVVTAGIYNVPFFLYLCFSGSSRSCHP